MNKETVQENGDSKQFIVLLNEQGHLFESINNITTTNLSQSNNCCLYSLKSKDLVCIKSL